MPLWLLLCLASCSERGAGAGLQNRELAGSEQTAQQRYTQRRYTHVSGVPERPSTARRPGSACAASASRAAALSAAARACVLLFKLRSAFIIQIQFLAVWGPALVASAAACQASLGFLSRA